MAGRTSTPKRETRKASAGTPGSRPAERGTRTEETKRFPLESLFLDGNNARLGAKAGQLKNQVEILDEIVNVFGIDDVLSSLAVNGYFEAEPLVGVQMDKPDKVRIAEGNRRLAACLILIGDARAKNHKKRTDEYQAIQKAHGREPIRAVPVLMVAEGLNLLSYLGVRHIAASQPWDSYAKAAWVAKILEESKLTLEDVSQMIGDQHRTVARTLEGFHFVNQLINAAYFNPEESFRRGRGSNTEYPFSWVYTALGYGPIRDWLTLKDLSRVGRDKRPIKNNKLDDAGQLLTFLFGNKRRQPAISDSRQIGELAKAIANPECLRHLKHGKTVEEVIDLLSTTAL